MEGGKSCELEEEFQSCCGEDEEWQDSEESLDEGFVEEIDEFSVRMFFKGVSVSKGEGLGAGVSGIGVVMERPVGGAAFQVQKKLDFFVEHAVAEHLALMDGLVEALANGVQRVFAYTDSQQVYDQIANAEILEDPLLVALGLRILEHADKLEAFNLKLVPSSDLKLPLRMALEATGVYKGPFGICGMCCETKQQSETIKLNCSHQFCYDCLVIYVEDGVQTSQSPISSLMASSSSQSTTGCLECPQCHTLACVNCGAPWHYTRTCEEYYNLVAEDGEVDDPDLGQLAQSNNWRRCQQCRQLIELTDGCHHMICRCGHEFCFSCGAEYRDGLQSCQCALSDEDNIEFSTNPSIDESNLWVPAVMDAYSEQERAQLALIQRFLAGGFGLSDHQPCQSPPPCSDSYMDTIKDLYQLPWLERFVSVISDSYHDEHIQ
ncbi:E3 ubiquitin ligase RBR family protein [Dioscorea alata]|nr:E3 ubiquitin ligase RBR family protein [Dioscorea alata]KAH7654484.1 E3 ubiquitin ligase RBR family protein [Dioscorea alata]